MIKQFITTGVLAFITTLPIIAQVAQPSNAGLENWSPQSSYESPNGWVTLDGLFVPLGGNPACSKVAGYEGAHAAKIVPITFSGNTLPGALGYAATYHDRPTAMNLYYKSFIGTTPDTIFYKVELYKAGEIMVGSKKGMITASQSNWTLLGVPISYSSSDTPDTLSIAFYSGSKNAQASTEFYVDAIQLVGGTAGIEEPLIEDLKAYPNPAKDVLNVKFAKEATIEIYNVLGSQIETVRSNGTANREIQTSSYPNGVYILKTSTGLTHRFVVKH